MKHIKLFEDFRKAETAFELNADARMYKLKKPLPITGHAHIKDQFEILLWIRALEDAKYDAMNRLSSFKNIEFVSWFTTKVENKGIRKYALRDFIPTELGSTKYVEKEECKFEDYFEAQPEFKGSVTGKQYGI